MTIEMPLQIESSRLILRQYQQSDIDAYAEMLADPEVMKYVGTSEPQNRQTAWRSLATMAGHWSLKGFGMWALEEKLSGEFIGRVGLFSPDGWPGIEIGWMLRRGFWGQGYAFEAAEQALIHIKNTDELNTVISLIHPENKASISLTKRLGSVYDRSSDVLIGDTYADIYRLDMNRK